MNRDGHEAVSFFVGTEVEHSPAYGEKTLFVIGIQDSTEILTKAKDHDCTHIYFGANQSFPTLDINDASGWQPWERMITDCLDAKFLCTLDLDISCAEGLLEGGLTERHNFIPMLSVKIPYIRQFPYGTTLKLDDKDFQATNAGVWCHNLHDLQKRRVFTDWSKYTQDKVLP
jgi:hypothetical protein